MPALLIGMMGYLKGRETSEKEKTNRAVQKGGATHHFIFCLENEKQLVIN